MTVKREIPSLVEQVESLAKLPPLEYDQVRKERAREMGVQVRTLDAEVRKSRSDDDHDDGSQADVVISLFNQSGAVLFHDDQDIAFAELPVDGHMEVWPIESKQFRKWLNRLFWNNEGRALREQPRKDAVSTLAGLAEIEGEECQVYLRVASHEGRHYLDLCNEQWQVFEIDASGWRVLDRAPVKFRRTSTMQALPTPSENGDFDEFWGLVNVSVKDRPFVLTWLVDALRANSQYPLLEIIGGHGTAKSTLHKLLRRLIDPNTVDLRGAPKNDEDVWVAARNNHCVSFENLSSLTAKMQDVLCTVATGGGHASREFYTNYDEVVVKALNPTIINGINPVVTASDLSDRTIRVHLETIDSSSLREEPEIRQAFEEAYPRIFSGLLNIFVGALNEIDSIELVTKPRMVSHAILGEAIGKSLGWEVSFNEQYMTMRESLLIEATQSSPAIMAILAMIHDCGTFFGNYKELLTSLDDDRYRSRGEGWPTSPRGLSGLITRHEPGLAAMGLKITRTAHGRTGSNIRIEPVPVEESLESQKEKMHEIDRHNSHERHTAVSRDDCDGRDSNLNTKKPAFAKAHTATLTPDIEETIKYADEGMFEEVI